MRRICLIILSVILLSACKNKASDDHLPPKVMQKILIDINLAETYSIYVKDNVHRGGMKNTDSLSAYYKTIFNHYKITQDEFYTSLEWYKAHPEELDSVYAKMIPVAALMQSKAIPLKTVVKTDSANTSKPDTTVNMQTTVQAAQKTDSVKSKKLNKKQADTAGKKKIHPLKKNRIDSASKK